MSDTTMTKIIVFSLIICVPMIIYLAMLIHVLKAYPIFCLIGQPLAFAPLVLLIIISMNACRIIDVIFFS